MEFSKIQVTKKNTLNIVFRDGAGNIVTVIGANIVHKDLKQAVYNLIPHLALITEQREADGRTLKEVEADRITDANSRSVFKMLSVDTIIMNGEEHTICLSGYRILQNGDVMAIQTPNIAIDNPDKYLYRNELDLAVDAVIYEAKQYYNEQKWGIKEGTLDFADDDPFKGVDAGTVPEADADAGEQKGKKTRGRKAKKVAVA